MNYASVSRVLAGMLLVAGGLMVLPLCVALIRGEGLQVQSFAWAASLTLLSGTAMALLTPEPVRPAVANEGLAAAILFWLVIPMPSAIPFVYGVPEPSLLMAYHEAVSCLTTTGHSVIDMGERAWPLSLIVWRGVLHTLGAVASITIAVAVFAALNLGGPGIHRSVLFTLPEGSFFDAIPRVLRAVSLMILAMAGALMIGLLLSGLPPGRALSDAISIVSTGLVLPNQLSLAGPGNFLGYLVTGFGLIAATGGIVVLMEARAGRWRRIMTDPELLLLILLVGLISTLTLLAGAQLSDGMGWSVSALATSGISVETPTAELMRTLPTPLLLLPALIGGAALSAAGGVKLARTYLLSRRAMQEFSQLGYRNSIVSLSFRGRHQEERAIMGVWVYVIAYIVAMTGLFAVLSFLGADFSVAMRASIGAVSNSGWLIDPPAAHQPWQHIYLIAAMILGRLEVLALVPALRPEFWQLRT